MLLPFQVTILCLEDTADGVALPLPVCQRQQLYQGVRKSAFSVMLSDSALVIQLIHFFTFIHLTLNTCRLVTKS